MSKDKQLIANRFFYISFDDVLPRFLQDETPYLSYVLGILVVDIIRNGKKGDSSGNVDDGTPLSPLSLINRTNRATRSRQSSCSRIQLPYQADVIAKGRRPRINDDDSNNNNNLSRQANTHTVFCCMPPSAGHHAFSCLRQRARRELVGVRHSGVITDRLKDGPKYVSLGSLKSAFGAAGLTFNEDEAEYVVKRFADHRYNCCCRILYHVGAAAVVRTSNCSCLLLGYKQLKAQQTSLMMMQISQKNHE